MARKIQKSEAGGVKKTTRPEDIKPPTPPGPPRSNYETDEDVDRLSDIASDMPNDLEIERVEDDEEIFDQDGEPVAAYILHRRRRAG